MGIDASGLKTEIGMGKKKKKLKLRLKPIKKLRKGITKDLSKAIGKPKKIKGKRLTVKLAGKKKRLRPITGEYKL